MAVCGREHERRLPLGVDDVERRPHRNELSERRDSPRASSAEDIGAASRDFRRVPVGID